MTEKGIYIDWHMSYTVMVRWFNPTQSNHNKEASDLSDFYYKCLLPYIQKGEEGTKECFHPLETFQPEVVIFQPQQNLLTIY